MQSKIAIFAAIILGIFAVVLIQLYLHKQQAETEGKTVKVLVATRSLKRGTIIKRSHVEIKEIARSAFWRQQHVTPIVFDNSVKGQELARDYQRGDFLSILDFVPEGETNYLRPSPGKTLKPIQVNNITGAAGLIREGDMVDLVVIQRLTRLFHAGTAPGAQPGVTPAETEVSLEDLQLTVFRKVIVRKLGTPRRTNTTPWNTRFRHTGTGSGSGSYSIVIVEMTPEQAITLTAVDDRSRFVLLPRNQSDTIGKEIIVHKMQSTELTDAIEELAEKLSLGQP